MKDNVIYIRLFEDLEIGRPPKLGRLLNRLRSNMEMADWKARNRAARSSEDPETWDPIILERLDREYEMLGLP